MPAVGSSSTSRSGSGSSARAKRSRCCSPPLHLATRRSPSRAIPARSSTSSTGAVARPVAAKVEAMKRTVSRTVRSPSRPPVCSTAETRPARTAARAAAPSTVTVPADGTRQAEHHVEGRRLAGPVGSEQSHHLATVDGQVEPIEGGDLTARCREGPPQPVQLDRGGSGARRRHAPSLTGGRPHRTSRVSRPLRDTCHRCTAQLAAAGSPSRRAPFSQHTARSQSSPSPSRSSASSWWAYG